MLVAFTWLTGSWRTRSMTSRARLVPPSVLDVDVVAASAPIIRPSVPAIPITSTVAATSTSMRLKPSSDRIHAGSRTYALIAVCGSVLRHPRHNWPDVRRSVRPTRKHPEPAATPAPRGEVPANYQVFPGCAAIRKYTGGDRMDLTPQTTLTAGAP